MSSNSEWEILPSLSLSKLVNRSDKSVFFLLLRKWLPRLSLFEVIFFYKCEREWERKEGFLPKLFCLFLNLITTISLFLSHKHLWNGITGYMRLSYYALNATIRSSHTWVIRVQLRSSSCTQAHVFRLHIGLAWCSSIVHLARYIWIVTSDCTHQDAQWCYLGLKKEKGTHSLPNSVQVVCFVFGCIRYWWNIKHPNKSLHMLIISRNQCSHLDGQLVFDMSMYLIQNAQKRQGRVPRNSLRLWAMLEVLVKT